MKAVSQYRRPLSALVAVLLVPASLGLVPGAAAAEPTAPPAAPSAAPSTAGADVELTAAAPLLDAPVNGPEALRELGDQVAVAAARNELSTTELRTLLRTDETAWVARDGAVYYVDPAPETLDAQPASAERIAPLAGTFSLNSNPGAALTILLDFDGATVTGTQWNASNGVLAGAHPAWDPAGNGPAFSDDELVKIQQVWAIVAEDYAPFDVNVTTQDPGQDAMVRSSSSDGVYGTRVLVSPSDDAYAKICNRQCGGVAFLGVFDRVGTYTQPAWVFPQALGDGAKYVAEAASHEAGHNLDLQHDGTSTLGYYEGHGIWAPIMGVGYGVPLSQWSRGSYVDADNPQDDVAILTGYLGARADDASDAVMAASPLPTGQALIGSRDDVDSYLLGSCPAGSVVEVAPSALAPNLDVRAVLYDATGAQRAVSAPASGRGTMFRATGLDTALVVPEAGHGWVVTVEGAGQGEWASLGYDDYGSLGSYTVTAPGCTVEGTTGVPSEPTGLTTGTAGLDSVTLTWSEPAELAGGPVTAYVVTRSGSSESHTLAATARSHTFAGLAPETSYTLSVRAVNAAGAGQWASVTATTQAPPPVAPSAPRNLAGSHNQQDGRLEVTWSEPADSGTQPVTGYAVYLNGVHLGQLGATARGAYLTRDGGYPDGTYVVGVAAVSAAGQSPTAQVTITVARPVAPSNDAVAAAEVIAGVSGSVVGDNTSATREATDPVPYGTGAGGYSVWYAWTPTSTGWVSMSTSGGGAGRSTTLSVMQGDPGSWWEQPGANYTYGMHASIWFKAQAGTRYLVAVDGYSRAGGVGPFTLTWDQAPEVKPGVPRNVKARAVLNSAHVTWDAPDGGPGSGPTDYVVRASPGGQECSTFQFPFDVTRLQPSAR
ncbi:fibronectin type III domain-containing protein [Nocardioides daphniae]|uniref:Fibronectin type-III domain-containing protein n=1 Tax=Nocardioides daphniae TaxID=402297 RepID=A0A4P7U855_9ACTN|nr:fibronectin type III domain-containing protein [Nocardioides daphniae]QCC76322.1 hypothetical protein E2C04_02260 [Nocardioides daphniae]